MDSERDACVHVRPREHRSCQMVDRWARWTHAASSLDPRISIRITIEVRSMIGVRCTHDVRFTHDMTSPRGSSGERHDSMNRHE